MKPLPAVPGVPAAGHIDPAGGWWHPGRPETCPKGSCGRRHEARPPWCREHRRPLAMCKEYGSTHLRPPEGKS